MIIQALLELVYAVFNLLTSGMDMPSSNPLYGSLFWDFVGYLKTGLQILDCYVDVNFLISLFLAVHAVDIGISLYHFVMWVLRKIPMLGIK